MNFTVTTSAEQIAHELLTLLPRLNRIIARQLQEEFGDDRTIVQMRVLGELADNPLTLSALARKRQVSLQAASEHVQSLVERGWVLRTPDRMDRRQSLLSLTDEGRRQVTDVHEHMTRQFTPIIEQFTDAEAESIHMGLQAMTRILSEQEKLID